MIRATIGRDRAARTAKGRAMRNDPVCERETEKGRAGKWKNK